MSDSKWKWDRRFLRLAAEVASWSKDPSSQTGAVVVDYCHRVKTMGFNGFPRGIEDDERLDDRETKYEIVLHAETNALLFSSTDELVGGTIYLYPWMCCSRCASMIIQVGIDRVVSLEPSADALSRWGKNWELAKSLLAEAHVILDIFPAGYVPAAFFWAKGV